MPPKDPKRESAFKEVVQVPLLQEHVEQIKTWVLEDTELLGMIDAYTKYGYQFGTTYSEQHKQYGVSVTCMAQGDVNLGYRYYANAPTLLAAFKVALFKLSFLEALPSWKHAGSAVPTEYS